MQQTPHPEIVGLIAGWLVLMITVTAAVSGVCALVGLSAVPTGPTLRRSAIVLGASAGVVLVLVSRHRLRPGTPRERVR